MKRKPKRKREDAKITRLQEQARAELAELSQGQDMTITPYALASALVTLAQELKESLAPATLRPVKIEERASGRWRGGRVVRAKASEPAGVATD